MGSGAPRGQHQERPLGELVSHATFAVRVADAHAHLERESLGLVRHQAAVEQPVQVGAQVEPVVDAVGAMLRVGLDARWLEDKERTFARDGAAAAVGAGDVAAERALVEALFDPGAAAVAIGVDGWEFVGVPEPQPLQHGLPHACPDIGREVLALPDEDGAVPGLRRRDALAVGTEERLRQEHGADDGVGGADVRVCASLTVDADKELALVTTPSRRSSASQACDTGSCRASTNEPPPAITSRGRGA